MPSYVTLDCEPYVGRKEEKRRRGRASEGAERAARRQRRSGQPTDDTDNDWIWADFHNRCATTQSARGPSA